MPDNFLASRDITLSLLVFMVVVTLIVLIPQLLRMNTRRLELLHEEHIKSLELGIPLPIIDDRSKVAGRMTLLVPMVVMITAGTVTCFLAIYNSDQIFPVSLAVWVVGGVVSLASITAGIALVSRLESLDEEDKFNEEEAEEPSSKH